jgi:putative addiction module CopG family antidote
MSNLSVSLTPELEAFIEREIEMGEFESKGQLVRKALREFEEDLVVARIIKASRDAKQGKIFRGDPRELIKKIK